MKKIRFLFGILLLLLLFGCRKVQMGVRFETPSSGLLAIVVSYNTNELEQYGFLATTTTEFLPLFQEGSDQLIEEVYSGLSVVHKRTNKITSGDTTKEYFIAFDTIESLNTLLYDVGFELVHETRGKNTIYTINRKELAETVQFSAADGRSSFEQPYVEDSSFILEMIHLLYAESSIEFVIQSDQTVSYLNKGKIVDNTAWLESDLATIGSDDFSWTVRLE